MASQGGQAHLDLLEEGHSKAPKDPPGVFSEPLVILPQVEYKKTFVILHGRGSTVQRFAPTLLSTVTPLGETLQSAFPDAKHIFLAASRSRATIYKRSYTYQWFDQWHMEDPYKRQDLMRHGLKKSCDYLHTVLKREIEELGKENVVLWGLSQGCATSLMALLTWDGEAFAAVVGMCGYLPFANHIRDIAGGDKTAVHGEKEEDPFFRSEDEDDGGDFSAENRSLKHDSAAQAVSFLRNEIEMDGTTKMAFQNVPVFLGHGIEDEKVLISNGKEGEVCLGLLGIDVKMVEYEGLGHWYSDEMLADIFAFLRERLATEGRAES